MKIQLELNILDDNIFLNFWDNLYGNDVVCEIIDGKLIFEEEEISLQEFIDIIKKAAKNRSS